MNGIILIDKPKDYTSRDIVNIVSKKLQTKKVGHTGTLDPLATGLLVLCIGKTLKLSELLVSTKKEYIATMTFGIETDTLDITGNIVKRDFNHKKITTKDIETVLKKYTGKIIQEVPKYSSVKVNGKKLYEYARKGEEVALPKREVEIFNIEPLSEINNNTFTFKCTVSKGTYIRSLIRDIGVSLGTYATMSDLRRTKQGIFNIEDAYTLEDIENNNYKILDAKDVLKLPKVIVDKNLEFKVKNGQVLTKFFEEDKAMIINQNNELLAIYQKKDDTYVKPYKML